MLEKFNFCVLPRLTLGKRRTRCVADIQFISLFAQPLLLPNLFQDVRSMQSLSVSGNWVNLATLESLLNRFPTLEHLNLDHTGIVNVPNSLFQGNHALRHLNLSQNLLVDLEPRVFQHLDRLEMLDLSSNFLMGLSMEFFQEVEKKKRMRMVYLQVRQQLGLPRGCESNVQISPEKSENEKISRNQEGSVIL